MTEESNPSSPPDDGNVFALMRQFRSAGGRRNVAKRTITLTILFVVVAFLFAIWQAATGFRDEGLPQFSATLSAEAAEFTPVLAERVKAMADRLVPVYTDAFAAAYAAAYADREEAFAEILVDEFAQLERYAHASWPSIEEALAQLVVDQEVTARNAIKDVISSEQIAQISMAYRHALESYMASTFEHHFLEQIAVGEDIVANLKKVARTETDVPAEDTQFLMGMMLELLGIMLQQDTGTYNYIVE